MSKKIIKLEDIIKDTSFNIDGYEGYIYLTINLNNGRQYLGKKNFFHNIKQKIGKKEALLKPITRGRTATHKMIRKESDWKTYYGSAVEIKSSTKLYPKESFIRLVLALCKDKKELTYTECKYLFQYNVLLNDKIWINDNILGKFFNKDFIK